jgi:serine/threonine protein kinase
MMEFSPGAEIAGYRIESVIGRGGMAVVYRAEDSRLGRKVALKLLAPVLAQNSHFQQRFIRESRLAASLDHPNIVPIYEAGESDGHLFIAMRYVPGSDLKGVLAQEERLSPARLLRLFVQIGDALDAAHLLGLVHRDVKPGNILVSSVVEHSGHAHPDHVYLTDFGLTKRTSSLSGSLTDTGHFLGTVDYVSPEQIQGGPLSPATDTYAFGCVLYESLTGQLPFNRDDDAAVLWAHLVEMPPPITAARPDLSPAVDDVVNRAMAKSPEDRYDTCSDLMRDLEQALDLPAEVSSLHSASTRPAARHRRTPGADSSALPEELPGSLSPVEAAPPPPEDPEATRAWVSHPSLPPGAMEPPRWPVRPRERASASEDALLGEDELVYDEVGPDDGTGYDDTGLEESDEDAQPVPPEADVQRPSGPGRGRRTWLLPAAALVLLVLAAALALFLVQSKRSAQTLATYASSSQESVVALSVQYPRSWQARSGSNAFVLTRQPDMAVVFTGQGGWGPARAVVRSAPDNAVGMYFTSLSAQVNPTQAELQAWITTNLTNSTVTRLGAPTQLAIGRQHGYELEGTLEDPTSPGSSLHAMFDIVVLPQGTALMTFFGPPSRFEGQRPLFEQMRASVAFTS